MKQESSLIESHELKSLLAVEKLLAVKYWIFGDANCLSICNLEIFGDPTDLSINLVGDPTDPTRFNCLIVI